MQVSSGQLSGFRVRRVYEQPEAADGVRVLVDRLWPRGVSRERAEVDEWLQDVTPSSELRDDFHHGRLDYPTFEDLYRTELDRPEGRAAVRHLLDLSSESVVTLVTAVREPDHSHVSVLLAHLASQRP